MGNYNETPVSRPAHTNNCPQPPRRRAPLGAIDHHIVGTLPGCTATFQNPNTGYATNYGIGSGDGRGGGGWWVHEYVPADYVAWGNGNTFLNTYGVSIEHENDISVAINGKPVEEVHELSARFHAALAARFGWRIGGKIQLVARDFPNHDYYDAVVPGFGVEFNVITHRSVALKDCPRDLDFGWITNRGNHIITEGADALEELTRKKDDMGLVRDTDGRVYWQGGAGRVHVQNILTRDLLARYERTLITAPKTPEEIPVFNPLELNIINNAVVAANTADDDIRAAILEKVADTEAKLEEFIAENIGADAEA